MMAERLIEGDPSTSQGNIIPTSPGSPGSPIRFIKSGQTARIPVTRIRCGKWDIRGEERWLEYEPSSTHLNVVYHERQHFDHEQCVSFNIHDISAADLRVNAKFSCLDTMNCVLTLECLKAIDISGSDPNVSCVAYVCELTFHVNYTGQVRDILRSLRQAKLTETSGVDICASEVGLDSKSKLREGLPDWVQYIPRRVYTPLFRHTIEYLLWVYTIFSILWALWQLYRHVDFIRAYVRPLIDALISQIKSLDKLIQVANTIFEKFTEQWLAYLKPVCVILTSFATPLITCGHQVLMLLSSILSIVKVTIQPLLSIFEPVFHILSLIFIKAPATILKPLYNVLTSFWYLLYETVGQNIYSSQLGQQIRNILQTIGEILERSVRLDPLKAQLILMRSNVLNSGKALGVGLVYIYKSIERRVWLVFRRTADDKED